MLKCPANYFGKGENYDLPADADELRDFERQFAEWEAAHPDDPDGSIALARAKLAGEPTQEKVSRSHAPPPPSGQVVYVHQAPETLDDIPRNIIEESQKLKLELPANYIERLKKYSSYKRRRPRDIIMAWIDANCKL